MVAHDSETPAHNQQVITACAFIHAQFDGVEKVFMPQRALTKKFLPGVYELPGGHVNFGEDPVLALQREIKEELKMDIRVGDIFFAFTYTNKIKGSHSVELDYFATFTSPLEDMKLDPEDHSQYKWFSEEEILKVREHDDPETQAILKAFSLLKGNSHNFG